MKAKTLISFVIVILISIGKMTAQDTEHDTGDEGIQFFEGSWDEALALAAKENKPIFLDVYASWCGPCKVLKSKTFPDAEAGKYFNEHFINVSLDGEKGDGIDVAQELQVQAYPSLFIVKSNGDPVAYYPGYLGPEDLVELGKAGIQQLNSN